MDTTKPAVEPQEITDVLLAFPGRVQHLMHSGQVDPYWRDWQSRWFFEGLKEYPAPKPGIDLRKAMRHLTAIQRSFEPKHEDKQASVAYLAGLWFEKPQE